LSEVTQGDLVAAVHEALNTAAAEDGYALTTNELCAALNVTHKKAWEMLRQLVKAKTVESVKVRRMNITGAPQRVAGYRVKAQPGDVVE